MLPLSTLAAMALAAMPMDAEPWRIVNDGVMGGRSQSAVTQTDDGLRFSGELSLENNGGFASTRRLVSGGFPGAAAIRIRVRGDGRRYQLRLRQDRNWDGVAWRHEFDTTGEWQTITLALDGFEPVWRGRAVPGAGPVLAEDVRQLGIMLADKQAGPFRLDIAAIEPIGPEV
jgi:monofunctional biosynthetic peptidoglycan transglycosylase